MAKVKIPYLVEFTQKGRVYFAWRPGKHVRALGFANEGLGTDRHAAIQRAMAKNEQVARERARLKDMETGFVPGTFDHLVRVYRGSSQDKIKPSKAWNKLADSTQGKYNTYLDRFLKKFHSEPILDFTTEIINSIHSSMAHEPHAANYALSVLSALFREARLHTSLFGITENPCHGVERYGKKEGVAPRDVFWSQDQQSTFLEVAHKLDPEVAMGFYLMVYSGQRLSDCLGMGTTDFDGDKIRVVQEKTDKKIWVPCHQVLKAKINQHIKDRAQAGHIGGNILQTIGHQEFKKRYFSSRWDKVMAKTGLTNLRRHDIRSTAVIRLAEAECTTTEIASITGHSLTNVESILAHYWQRTYKQAENAISKLEKSENIAPEKAPK
ncbi:tyrosine-type recombinase/integrase [Kiloniella sp.]|uniref:tyrosine-type recombinase/integrase n=1 Tax=Kiloniella sp. TaxID=1938587 RepID=UPI003B013B3C